MNINALYQNTNGSNEISNFDDNLKILDNHTSLNDDKETSIGNDDESTDYGENYYEKSNQREIDVTTAGDNIPCEEIDPNYVMLKDKIISQDGRNIPRVMHFVVRSRCVPQEVAKAHNAGWESVSRDHSILYHDQKSIDEYMARDRRDWPAVASAYKCAFDPMAKNDLAKLMLLWDHGGIVVDMGHIPGPEFEEGNVISDKDECVFEMAQNGTTNPRFLACQARHSGIFAAIIRFITMPFVDYTPLFPYTWEKRSDIFGFVASFMEGEEIIGNKSLLRHKTGQLNGTITQIHTNSTVGELLKSMDLRNDTLKSMELELISAPEQEKCMNRAVLKNDSYKVDIASLLDLVGYGKDNSTCIKPPNFIGSNYDEGSIVQGRKIPKIIHMTSKFRCFTGNYTLSINKWKFDGYSLFMHDDAAVDRLLSKEWPEFPLLKEARSCIATGAGMADLWRYLVIWEYGGIYTDIDNEPGPKFLNASLITDDMDSLFEQEGGGFPSQYFFAGKP
jgi:mannosyltransferase OCH1-like enzyme